MIDKTLTYRIQQELKQLQQAVVQTQRLVNKIQVTDDSDIIDALIGSSALNMQSFYTGVENILYEIARDIDEEVPSGKSWHRDLLEQMSVAIPSVREAVISTDTLVALDEFRRFRHVVRSHYAFDLDHERILGLVNKLVSCNQLVLRDIKMFCANGNT